MKAAKKQATYENTSVLIWDFKTKQRATETLSNFHGNKDRYTGFCSDIPKPKLEIYPDELQKLSV